MSEKRNSNDKVYEVLLVISVDSMPYFIKVAGPNKYFRALTL
jgi:hypothetical protein